MELSVIVPFHRNLVNLNKCLSAVRAAAAELSSGARCREVIVVADGAPDDPTTVAAAHGARVLVIAGPRGPAVARNRGAAGGSGDVLVFVDSDVVISSRSLTQFATRLTSEPDVGAVFGAYDENPACSGFISQGKNLAHSFIHQRSAGEARTFWAGLGAVRADLFERVGGFDERFGRPSVEDIDLGYRLRAIGGRIQLDPLIQGQHLKCWTFVGSVVSDIKDRGIPWTQLLHRYEGVHEDLNLTRSYRACVALSYMLALCVALATRWPMLAGAVPPVLLALWGLDRPYYQFFASRRGWAFAAAWFPFHIFHHLCNGLSFAVGTVLYASQRWMGISLPGALPCSPWSAESRPSPAC